MATEPSIGARKQFSDMFSMPDFQSTPGAGGASMDNSRQFGAMINEIERVRSRFENEKTNSAQFGQQMSMLAQQIESLTGQQATMLGFHIGRMDMMLKELKNSKDSLTKEEQRAAFEAETRAKFEREREEREHREREDRERRELVEKLEREHREREEKERREREEKERREREERERREREHREKMQSLQNSSLPSMSLSDMIPQPSRTVTASKRKLSLDASSSSAGAASSSGSSSAAATADSNKRAKTGDSEDFQSLFKRFMQDQNKDDDAPPPKPLPAAGDTMSDVEDASNAMTDDAPAAAAAGGALGENDLPPEIQEQLKLQAMEMLQAQLAAGESAPESSLTELSPGSDAKPKESASSSSSAAGPMASLSSGASSALSSAVKPEPGSEQPPAAATFAPESKPAAPAPSAATPVKAEKPQAATKSAKKRTKKPKVVTPAVEDTTIADPMSVPLKNKAIHQWMMKDPDRLYTADDICKAGIRYRAAQGRATDKIQSGRVYVLNDYSDVRSTLRQGRNNRRFWVCEGKRNGQGLWKPIQRQ